MLKLGLFLIGTGGVLFFASRRVARAHVWTPVRVPLAFDTRHTVSATFTADMKADYEVQIDLERNLPFDQLLAIVQGLREGKSGTRRGAGTPVPNVPEIVWSVRSGGKAVALGGYSGSYWGGNVGCTVGSLEAVPGQQFVIKAEVKKAAPELQALNPHLPVEVSSPDYKPYYVWSALIGYLAVFALLIGLGVSIMGGLSPRAAGTERRP